MKVFGKSSTTEYFIIVEDQVVIQTDRNLRFSFWLYESEHKKLKILELAFIRPVIDKMSNLGRGTWGRNPVNCALIT